MHLPRARCPQFTLRASDFYAAFLLGRGSPADQGCAGVQHDVCSGDGGGVGQQEVRAACTHVILGRVIGGRALSCFFASTPNARRARSAIHLARTSRASYRMRGLMVGRLRELRKSSDCRLTCGGNSLPWFFGCASCRRGFKYPIGKLVLTRHLRRCGNGGFASHMVKVGRATFAQFARSGHQGGECNPRSSRETMLALTCSSRSACAARPIRSLPTPPPLPPFLPSQPPLRGMPSGRSLP